jgi:tetratricopeptide (TPR) repeat protein
MVEILRKTIPRSLAAALMVMVCLTLALAQRQPRLPVEVQGQVRYADGGAPADKVLVRVEIFGGGLAGQTLTDRTGKFQFTGLSRAQYIVTVRSQGFKEVRQQVDLQTTARAYLQFQLVAETDASAPVASSGLLDARVPPEAQKEYEKGRAELLLAKTESGRAHLEKAVSLYPDFIDAHLLLGTVYMDGQQWERAEAELRRTLEINPKLAAAFFALGEVYRRQKDYDAAEKALREGLKLEPRSHQGHLNLGRVYFDRDDLAKAGPEVGQAIQLKPDFAEAHLLAGNILLRARQPENALQMFEQYLRLEPRGAFAAQARELVARIKQALAGNKSHR